MGSSMKNRYKLMANPNSYGRTTCSAYGCDMRCGTNALSEIKMFHFPKDPYRRRRWELATRRANWKASNKSRLCCKHFITGKPSKDPKHPDYVPSIFVFNKNVQILKNSSQNAKLKTHGKLNDSEATCHDNTSSQEGTCPSCGVKFFCSNCFSSESVSTAVNMSLAPFNQTLTELTVRLKDMEEEREQLRNELASCREEIFQFREAHQHCMIQFQSTNSHSRANSFGSNPSTTDEANEILDSMYSGEVTDESDVDSVSSLLMEQNYYQPDKSSIKKHTKETHSDEVKGIIEHYPLSKKRKMKNSNLESKGASEYLKSEKSSDSSSPITIVYLKR